MTVGAIAVVGVGVTIAVSLTPVVRFAYRSREAQVAVETADGLAAAAVAYLFLGRVRRRPSSRDLFLTIALAVFAGADLIAAIAPGILRDEPATFTTWAPSWYRFAGTCLLVAAAVLPDRILSMPTQRRLITAAVGVAGASAVGLSLLSPRLPRSLDPILVPELSGQPRITGPPLFLTLQAVSAILLAIACVCFTIQAEYRHDPLLRWLGAASALLMLARINYFLFPSNVSEWFYLGDLFRLGFSLMLLTAAAAEVRSYWESQSKIAVLNERRRLARDLHDGVVQELGYIRMRVLGAKGAGLAHPVLDEVLAAADRGGDEARRAFAALTTPSQESLTRTFEQAGLSLADRHGITVHCVTDPTVAVTPSEREDVLRVLREATANAARHGGADLVEARLFRTEEVTVLSITDNGTGFDPTLPHGSGFGLTSMRDRALALGGRLDIRSEPGGGTIVRMEWP